MPSRIFLAFLIALSAAFCMNAPAFGQVGTSDEVVCDDPGDAAGEDRSKDGLTEEEVEHCRRQEELNREAAMERWTRQFGRGTYEFFVSANAWDVEGLGLSHNSWCEGNLGRMAGEFVLDEMDNQNLLERDAELRNQLLRLARMTFTRENAGAHEAMISALRTELERIESDLLECGRFPEKHVPLEEWIDKNGI